MYDTVHSELQFAAIEQIGSATTAYWPDNAMTRMNAKPRKFDLENFLTKIGKGRTTVSFPKKHTVFAQGAFADAVFYIQGGAVKLTVVSKGGKEATIGILSPCDFFGEGCLAGQHLRMSSATTMTQCSLIRIERKSMLDMLHKESEFSDMFVSYLLAQNIRSEADLVDQLFNSSEAIGPTPAALGAIRKRRMEGRGNSESESGDFS